MAGDSCNNTKANFSGKVALVSRNGSCSFTKKLWNAEQQGAEAVIVYNSANADMVDMNCAQDDCDIPIGIQASMISFEDGLLLVRELEQQSSLAISFSSSGYSIAGYGFAIDSNSTVQALGYVLFPSFQHYSWTAEYLNYIRDVHAQQRHFLSEDSRVINIWRDAVLSHDGLNARIPFPSPEVLQKYDRFELELILSCESGVDSTCPAWDQTLDVRNLVLLLSLVVVAYPCFSEDGFSLLMRPLFCDSSLVLVLCFLMCFGCWLEVLRNVGKSC